MTVFAKASADPRRSPLHGGRLGEGLSEGGGAVLVDSGLQLGDRDNDLSGPAIGIVAVVSSVVGPVTSRTVPAIDGPAIVVGVIQVAP